VDLALVVERAARRIHVRRHDHAGLDPEPGRSRDGRLAGDGVGALLLGRLPDSGSNAGCLWIESGRPVLVSGTIQSVSQNPSTGFSDSRVTPLEFWPAKWAPLP
jgi:hypothetical protein